MSNSAGISVDSLISIVFIVTVGFLGFTTAYLGHSVIRAIASNPDLLRQFPEAGWSIRDPAKLFFLLSAASKVVLSKHPQLLKRRNLFFGLVMASVVAPPVIFILAILISTNEN